MDDLSLTTRDEADLTGMNVFVGGPIQHAIQRDGFYSPLRDAIHDIIESVRAASGTVFSAHLAEKFGDDTALFTPEQVAERDLRWMRRCDVFVPVLPAHERGGLLRTDGTHVELGWASALGKPIVLVTPLPVTPTASHLLRGLPAVAQVGVFDITRVQHDRSTLLGLISSAARDTVAMVD
ncbi:hypothetical protein GCM10012275_37620 [Longimycelium tulufanense]|uniref:Nucleoside 2-deoxyribosyltransferase n=1 Tax=Longimycelium tulufanense TaxID=907463 RepID=A0A8J3FVG4_9PSEU|nr:nucleoside 2-deoxyribosyltransferase [Longimycelium tulufanense]GGM63496.1 hypothetical protein GCM10012275_37620 [Longimycelium tulufanense]